MGARGRSNEERDAASSVESPYFRLRGGHCANNGFLPDACMKLDPAVLTRQRLRTSSCVLRVHTTRRVHRGSELLMHFVLLLYRG